MMIDVPIWPGSTTDARRWGALSRKSVMRASVKPRTANLAVLYAVCGVDGPTDAHSPLMLLRLMRCPSSACRSMGRNTRVLR